MRRTTYVWGILAVAGIAAASALTVTQRTDTVNIFAERVTLRDQFVLANSSLQPAPATLAAQGDVASAAELSAVPLASARTAVARDHWTYAVEVKEVSVNAVTSGFFELRLIVDGTAVGSVYVAQLSPNPNAIEGVVATFDIGASLSSDALYYVEVKPFTPPGSIVGFTLRSNPSGNNSWLGVGAPIDAQVAPALTITTSQTLRLTIRLGDPGNAHNIGITADGTNAGLLTPPGWSDDIDDASPERTFTWTPASAGAFHYKCRYHAGMSGPLVVTA